MGSFLCYRVYELQTLETVFFGPPCVRSMLLQIVNMAYTLHLCTNFLNAFTRMQAVVRQT